MCDRVTVTTADGTPLGVSTVAYRTMFKGSEAEFETAWESFGAPEDVDTDPKPLVVFHASLRRWPADPGPPPRSLALRVRDVEPRGGDALRGRALHPPPGAGRRARNARRSRVTPAPPDAPPTGAVCGDGVASVDDLYACAAGGRLSGVSAGRACPCRRRRAARRASHAPHGRLSACSVGTIRQPVIVVCVFAMRRSSDIGMVTYIAMVASIWRVASIGRVASRLGESVPSVAEGVRPPRRAGRAGRDTLRLPSVWRAWCAACRVGTIRQPIIVVCVFAMRRSSRHREGHLHLDRYIHLDHYIRHICYIRLNHYICLNRYICLNHYIRLNHCIRYIRLDRYIRLESGVSAGRVCRGGDPPAARRPCPAGPARLTRPRVRPREPSVGPADGGRPCVAGGGVVSCAPPTARLAARPGPPLHSRVTAAPIVPYNSRWVMPS